MADLRKVTGNTATAGMNKDLDPQALKPGQYVTAINAKLNNQAGNLPFLTAEPANKLLDQVPLTVIGIIKLPSGKFAIFSTDDFQGEIGLFDEVTGVYERTVRSTCLGFNKKHLIVGAAKTNFDCSEAVYFTDGVNPRRYFNFSHIPFKFTTLNDECKTKEFTDELDCDELLVDKKISYPKITVEFGTDGSLVNGSYQVAIAYVVNGQVATDWLGVTFPIKTFDHFPRGKSLDIKIDNLDREFDQYSIAVIYTINGSTAVDKVGVFSTAESNITVTAVGPTAINNTLLTLDEVVNKRPVYGTADDVTSTSQFLLWANPSTKKELDYQRDAMNITAKWVAYKLPPDYYRKGGNAVGYMRDEVYTFGIQWLYSTGDWSPVYHIPGRLPLGREVRQISGQDVYEKSSASCDDEDLPFYFEVNNTAKLTAKFAIQGSICDPAIVAEGTMAYWQSTELYPDKDFIGENRCTPIRHHKFPDCAIINHHDSTTPIILGVKFENIKLPEGVVGYRIVRGDRLGNRSIKAKGLLFNTFNYTDNEEAWMAPNYAYNDLRTDPFLSTTQTKFNGNETDFNPVTDFNRDKFTFHSPSTSFNKPLLGTELKLETEEIGTVKGQFQEVYRHPKYKFITNFSYGIASAIALGGAFLAVRGRKCVTAGTQPGGVDGAPRPFSYAVECETELMGKVGIPGGIIPVPNIVGITIAMGYYFALGLQSVINLIKLLSSWEQFAYQYNSQSFYSRSTFVRSGNRRRRINYAQYLIPGNQEINGVKMNNFNRESSVYMELNSNVADPSTPDNSRNTISGFGLCDNVNAKVISTASSYYGSIKVKRPNQYGQLDAIRYLDTGVVYDITDDEFQSSGHVFGGDTYIGRHTEKRKLTYFNLWPIDVPDGWEWDYRKYANIPYPRFWLDGTEFDFGDMARLRLPSSKHNLDCYRPTRNFFTVKDRYMYLFNSGVIDFFCESEYNIDFRDWDDSIEGRHYDWHTYTNLQELFRSDKIQFDNRFIFDKVYLKQLTENYIPKQSLNFDPESNCFVKYDNRIIYSLAAQKEQVRDNWLIYPGLNYFDFSREDGLLTTVKSFDNDRLLFLFDGGGPQITMGIDTLETDGGTKVLIGDGGVFARRPQKLVTTKHGYGSCQTKIAWSPTQMGYFYPSQEQGRVFNFTGNGVEDISRNGLNWWYRENLPSNILKDYPDFIHKDNPLVGVGLVSVFDNTDEIYYISKTDYKVKDEWKDVVTYDATKDQWKARGIKIDFKDPLIFEDASWTVSYDPKMKVWVSYHDWHPELTVQTESKFITIKDKGFWKHNDRKDLFCNFYGQDAPFEIEVVQNNEVQTSTLSSLEYSVEAYKYKNINDKYHDRYFNFDRLLVFNTEQVSGDIHLEQRTKDMISLLPIFHSNHMISEYSKVEQKYRINQFFDLTKDRTKDIPVVTILANGYRKIANKLAVDYGKRDKKKFRHNYNNILLKRTVLGDKELKFRLIYEKEIVSVR